MPTSPSPKQPDTSAADLSRQHADGTTSRPEYPELEGRTPMPEEITGRASGTNDDLVELFVNTSNKHLEDGFHDTSEDESRDDGEEPTIQDFDNRNVAKLPNRNSGKE